MAGTPEVAVLAELELNGIAYDWAGEDEVRVRCPFHDDQRPSCGVNTSKRVFRCPVCSASGDVVSLLAGFLKTTRQLVLLDLGKRYNLDGDSKVISADVIEQAHGRIWGAGPLLKALRDRGISDAIIRKRRLGERDGRITIPIPNDAGLFVNVRSYSPGAPASQKMKNARGHGRVMLYPVDQLTYDRIVVCGGEIKALAAADQLNKHGIGAVSATAGEGNWAPHLTARLLGKHLWVCMDVDQAGRDAAQVVCAQVYRSAAWTGDVLLPLDLDKYPTGDVNDFIAQEGGDLYALLEATPEWKPRQLGIELTDDEPERLVLHAACEAKWTGKRVEVEAAVSMLDSSPYVVPSKAHVACDRSQPECAVCQVFRSQDEEFTIPAESPAILDMVASPRSAQRDAVMTGVGIPLSCKSAVLRAVDYYNVEDVRVAPRLDVTNTTAARSVVPALCVGYGLELNECYDMVGRMYPHPKTQQATLLISHCEPREDALSSYVVRDVDRLGAFQPDEWTVDGLRRRLNALYEDIEANITHTYERRDMHLLVDLAYHSPLLITLDGKARKGWAEVLIVGDSSNAKSQCVLSMQSHYGLGEKVECKNASVAGLLGGCVQSGNRWFISWGVMPTQDKRLVILEELKGASVEIISKLTDMRSSGVAEIPKIEKRKTHARTRIIAMSNPRSDRQVAAYNFGIETIAELIGNPEDVRRFDACMILSNADITPQRMSELQSLRPDVPHTHDRDLCRSLVLWCWTRAPGQVTFDDAAIDSLGERSREMCSRFTDAMPIVDRGSFRHKLARLSAALAGRTFSTGMTSDHLLIRGCHVEFVANWLSKIYSSSSFGYLDFTAATRLTQELVDEDKIIAQLETTPFPGDMVKQLLGTQAIELVDFQDWCGWDRASAAELLSFLVRKHALVRDKRQYRKTPPFIRLLKQLADGKIKDRPSHAQEF